MTNILADIIELLTSGIGSMATGIGNGVGNLVTSLFLVMGENGAVEGLSTFGSVTVIFAGIGLAIGLSKLIMHWIGSLGGSRV